MFDENLSILKEYYPEIYNKIITLNSGDAVKFVESKNGMMNLTTMIEDKMFYLHSTYNPANEAVQWVNNLHVKEDTIVIIGFGLGYYLEKLFEKYPDKKLIIVEPNLHVFSAALKVLDMKKHLQSDKIAFVIDEVSYGVGILIKGYLEDYKIDDIYVTELPIYRKLYPQYVESVYADIKEQIFAINANINTQILFSEMWLENTLYNLQYLMENPSVNNLRGSLKGIPVVIVSAGPSLQKNMHLLKEIYHRALIISVGSSANILENHGIAPHIVMGVDGGESEANIFKNLKNHEPLFVYANTVHYEAVKTYTGRKMWLQLDIEKSIENICDKLGLSSPIFYSAPSVANIALQFAFFLESSPILLIGQDLAYTNERLYAKGSVHGEVNDAMSYFSNNNLYFKVTDIYGNEVYTKKTFISMKKWFEDYIALYGKNKTIVNCTEGGLEIEGIRNDDFASSIEQYCVNEYPISEIINQWHDKKQTATLEKYEELLSQLRKESKKILMLSKERVNKAKSLDVFSPSFSSEFAKLMKIVKRMEKIFLYDKVVQNAVEWYIKLNAGEAHRRAAEDQEKTLDEKRKILVNELIKQYEFVDSYIEIVHAFFETKGA